MQVSECAATIDWITWWADTLFVAHIAAVVIFTITGAYSDGPFNTTANFLLASMWLSFLRAHVYEMFICCPRKVITRVD